MKAFLILEDGTVFTGTSIGSTREVISEIVFNTSMTGYLEVLTDPSYAGQAVVMTYPLIGNYGITPDMESARPWPDGYIVRELSRTASNFRCEGTIQDFLLKHDIPGVAGIDTRALTKILREKGTMNGMITTNENYNLDEILPKLKEYTTGNVVDKVTCSEKKVLRGTGKKVALLDLGAKNNIAKSLNARGCEVTIYPAHTSAEEILATNPDGIMLSNGPGDPKECKEIIEEIHKLYESDVPIFAICLGHQLMALATGADTHKMKYGHREEIIRLRILRRTVFIFLPRITDMLLIRIHWIRMLPNLHLSTLTMEQTRALNISVRIFLRFSSTRRLALDHRILRICLTVSLP